MERELSVKVNGYNAAKAGNNAMHSINILINKLVPVRPNYVVMMHAINDSFKAGEYWKSSGSEYSLIGNFERPAKFPNNAVSIAKMIRDATIPYTWNYVRRLMTHVENEFGPTKEMEFEQTRPEEFRITPLSEANINETDRKKLKEFMVVLQLFGATARVLNMEPVLMTQPTAGLLPKYGHSSKSFATMVSRHGLINQATREMAASKGIFIIDLAAEFARMPDRATLFYDFVHVNEDGSRRIAQIISRAIANRIRGSE